MKAEEPAFESSNRSFPWMFGRNKGYNIKGWFLTRSVAEVGMCARKRKTNKLKGYTLVEVLIVLSIIGVLMGFLLNGVIKARQKGRLTRLHILLDSIAAGIRMYQDDFGAYPPNDVINRFSSNISGSEAECLYYYLGATFKSGVNASVFAGAYMKFSGGEVQLSRGEVGNCDFDGDSPGTYDDYLREVIDPWGNPLHYTDPPIQVSDPPTQNLNTYDLYSNGPDGVDDSGGGDDINNWD